MGDICVWSGNKAITVFFVVFGVLKVPAHYNYNMQTSIMCLH